MRRVVHRTDSSCGVAAAAYECFDVEIAGKVAHIRLNRPEALNTMVRSFWTELPAIVRDIDANARARCIVISSSGKHFSAGMDLALFSSGSGSTGDEPDRYVAAEGFRHHVRWLQEAFACLAEARMPVLAAIQGGCVGGAVDMISACDIRYATKDAFFCIQEINIGMTADLGTFPRLCRLIPDGWVRELAYTGRQLPADKAKAIGLVNEVFDTPEEMLAVVIETANAIASKAPLAVTGSKVMINYARDHTIRDGLDHIALWNAGILAPPQMTEAFSAKQEKRTADFTDLLPLRAEV